MHSMLQHFRQMVGRIMSGMGFREIADMYATSIGQIERTRHHLNDEIRLINAVADYHRRNDGTIEVI